MGKISSIIFLTMAIPGDTFDVESFVNAFKMFCNLNATESTAQRGRWMYVAFVFSFAPLIL